MNKKQSDCFWSCCSIVNLEKNFDLSWTHLNFLLQSPLVVVYSTTLSIKYFCGTYLFTCIFNQLLYVTLKTSKSSQKASFLTRNQPGSFNFFITNVWGHVSPFFFCLLLTSVSFFRSKMRTNIFSFVCLQQLCPSDFFGADYLKDTPSLSFSQSKVFPET